MIPFEPSLNNPGGKTLADLLIVIFIPFSETLDIEFGEHNKWRNMLCGFELGFTSNPPNGSMGRHKGVRK